MAKILNIGSINVDHVYAVDRFVRPGETVGASSYRVFPGGKGFNQSIALARAGVGVSHLGKVGEDGRWLLERLARDGVDTACVGTSDHATGHAIIQVVPSGENTIMIHGGANRDLDEAGIAHGISRFGAGDWLLLQNETNMVGEAIRAAARNGMRIAFNPAPMDESVRALPLDLVDLFVVNETEAEGLAGASTPDGVRAAMAARFPKAATVLTTGSEGAWHFAAGGALFHAASKVDAVDTTAAGDTFIGYFLAEFLRGGDPARSLAAGCRAAAICVTRAGAADSIPARGEVDC